MNRVFLAKVSRGDRIGALARLGLGGGPTLDPDTPASERLTRLLVERENALTANDADALYIAEHRVDRLFAEAVADRKPEESDQAEQPGYDGGVRQRRTFQRGGATMTTSSELMAAALIHHPTPRRDRRPRLADLAKPPEPAITRRRSTCHRKGSATRCAVRAASRRKSLSDAPSQRLPRPRWSSSAASGASSLGRRATKRWRPRSMTEAIEVVSDVGTSDGSVLQVARSGSSVLIADGGTTMPVC